jgi:Ca2+-binding EF-hand superfamily protein
VGIKQFHDIFAQFFPQGNSRRYADLVFQTLDKDGDEKISFEVEIGAIFCLYSL